MDELEKQERYGDFRRGWLCGVNSILHPGAPEPRYRDEYDRGYEEGVRTFNAAMEARFKALEDAD